jgi:hypothetical protein
VGLVQQKKEPWQLYDLKRDRTETQNLSFKFPERVNQMKNTWEEWAKDIGIKISTKKKN